MWKIVKKVLRAAVAQPWDYVGEGAPEDWEFRLSPDEGFMAIHNPADGLWVVFEVKTMQPVDSVNSLEKMNKYTRDWGIFLRLLDED